MIFSRLEGKSKGVFNLLPLDPGLGLYLPGAPKTIKIPGFWYLKSRFIGGENLCFLWFWVLLVRDKSRS